MSLLALAGRIHVPYQGWNRHVALLQEGATIGGAKLWYDRSRQRFYLLVSLTLEAPDPTPERMPQVLGVDVGQRYLATVATLDNGAQFYSGKEIREPRRPLRPLAKTTGAEKALAAPPGDASPLARERDG